MHPQSHRLLAQICAPTGPAGTTGPGGMARQQSFTLEQVIHPRGGPRPDGERPAELIPPPVI